VRSGPAPRAGGAVKIGGALLVALAVAGVGYVAIGSRGPSDGAPPAPSAVTAVAPRPTNDPIAPVPAISAPAPEASAAPLASGAPRASAALVALSASASASAPARSEIEILREAQAALASSPTRALALTDEHARAHPKGSMGQEREMIRIQALVALGRRDEARALAKAFKERHPSSAYAQRLDSMLP
jgi:hypothetical protein